MFHFVARAFPFTRLWRDSAEANALWRILTRTFPELVALCLMPDHIHLLLPQSDEARRFSRALAAYARWQNHHRRQRGRGGRDAAAAGPPRRGPRAAHHPVHPPESLPEAPGERSGGVATWDEVHDAVCALARVEPEALLARGKERLLLVKTAWMHGIRDVPFLARAVGLTTRRIYQLVEHLPARGSMLADPALAACVRVVGDPRFAGYPSAAGRAWSRYR